MVKEKIWSVSQFASTGPGLNIIQDRCYGYSGAHILNNSSATHFEFTTGKYIIEGMYQITFDMTNMEIVVVKNPNYWNVDYVVSDKIIFKKIGEKATAITQMATDDIQIMDAQYVVGYNELEGMGGIVNEFSRRQLHQEMSLPRKLQIEN